MYIQTPLFPPPLLPAEHEARVTTATAAAGQQQYTSYADMIMDDMKSYRSAASAVSRPSTVTSTTRPTTTTTTTTNNNNNNNSDSPQRKEQRQPQQGSVIDNSNNNNNNKRSVGVNRPTATNTTNNAMVTKQYSNFQLIKNALTFVCLAGGVYENERIAALDTLDTIYSNSQSALQRIKEVRRNNILYTIYIIMIFILLLCLKY